MQSKLSDNISRASMKAYIGGDIVFEDEYRPQLVCNKPDRQVLDVILKELSVCEEFWFSVAFITFTGVAPIKGVLRDIEKSGRKVKGHILTTDYQDFTEPNALRSLLTVDFIDVRVAEHENFHTKGYCFKKHLPSIEEDRYTILIGSSNMTGNALKVNKEWNVQSVSKSTGQFTIDFLDEFYSLWNTARNLTSEWINEYEERRKVEQETFIRISKESMTLIYPNYMQEKALEGLNALRANGKDKGLLIAATGTGKTYLSAFDVRNVKPHKMLYVVHREQILDKAMESFEQVLGKEEFTSNCGKFAGGRKETDKKYIFATIQSILQPGVMQRFPNNYFDYIIVDEVHKAGARQYQKFIEYFRPKFMLGMSATPDRTDRVNIYEMFGYNIAYEIRLKDALEADLVCPFNYYGVTDLSEDGKLLSDKSAFSQLVADERVDRILENARYFGFDGVKLQGLIFCSTLEEGEELSRMINERPYDFLRNYRTVFLSGSNSIEEREEAIERLSLPVSDSNSLDYIITVDIFNEGIDIPDVNQVLMLRPTQSAIIFTQQLGRGLRKAPRKSSVVVVDFIGNYCNNFLIPIALFGDNTYNKDNVRRYVAEGTRMIPGISSMHFDEISKERIYDSIDHTKFQEKRLIKSCYRELKNKLGRIPTMKDFDDYHAYNILNIINQYGSYYAFLEDCEEDYKTRLKPREKKMLEFISRKYASGKSRTELSIIENLMDDRYDIDESESDIYDAVRGLSLDFSVSQEKDKFDNIAIAERSESGVYASAAFNEALEDPAFYALVEETVEYGLNRNSEKYRDTYKDTKLVLNEKYSYEDVCRLLGWNKNSTATMNGYKYDMKTDTFPVFINYEKSDDAILYRDRFETPRHLIAISKKDRRIGCKDWLRIYRKECDGISHENTRFYLFVRKNKLEESNVSKEFYFLGEINAEGEARPIELETGEAAFEIDYILETPVRDDIYDYLQSKV